MKRTNVTKSEIFGGLVEYKIEIIILKYDAKSTINHFIISKTSYDLPGDILNK